MFAKLDNAEMNMEAQNQGPVEKRVQRSLSLVKERIFVILEQLRGAAPRPPEGPTLVSMERQLENQALASGTRGFNLKAWTRDRKVTMVACT